MWLDMAFQVEREKGKFTPRHCRLQSRVLLFHWDQELTSVTFPCGAPKAAFEMSTVPSPAQLPDLLSTSSLYHDSFCVSLISPTCYFVI
jgi:hypothetical protein